MKKRLYLYTINVLVFIAGITIYYNFSKEENKENEVQKPEQKIEHEEVLKVVEKVEENSNKQKLEPIDQKLGDHQVALGDLYFEIPMEKDTIFIDRRIEGEYSMVDIRDLNTNELLYRYGESKNTGIEKEVFREVQKENVTVRIIASLYFSDKQIKDIKSTRIELVPNTVKFEKNFVGGTPRTGELPTDKIEVMANGYFPITNEQFYEAYVIGVIK